MGIMILGGKKKVGEFENNQKNVNETCFDRSGMQWFSQCSFFLSYSIIWISDHQFQNVLYRRTGSIVYKNVFGIGFEAVSSFDEICDRLSHEWQTFRMRICSNPSWNRGYNFLGPVDDVCRENVSSGCYQFWIFEQGDELSEEGKWTLSQRLGIPDVAEDDFVEGKSFCFAQFLRCQLFGNLLSLYNQLSSNCIFGVDHFWRNVFERKTFGWKRLFSYIFFFRIFFCFSKSNPRNSNPKICFRFWYQRWVIGPTISFQI